MRSLTISLALLAASFIPAARAAAQSQLIMATVHSPGLEHNLLGDPADQPVAIYLPAAYAAQPDRRFPVLYFLHGYTDRTPRQQAGEDMQRAMDRAIAAGTAQPFIIVLPNGLNKYAGAFYTNSSTTGNWDDYITRDLVAYIDQHFRTQPDPAHRAISGHSMGGYGALTLAFRHPEVFGSVYALSPCCTDLIGDMGPSNPAWRSIAKLQSPDEVPAALHNGQFFIAAFTAMSAALAPDPASKTLGDPPFIVQNGEVRTDPQSFSRIATNMPANMVFPLLPNIMKLHGIFIDYGAQDNFAHIVLGAQETAARLSQAGVSNTLEVYQGDHGNHVADRIENHMLPWVSNQLSAHITH